MNRSTLLAAALVGALAASASAGLNRAYLVPAYVACPGSGNCFPPVLASTYTFDSIILYSSPKPYSAPGKLALQITIKGLKDAAGAPVTATLQLRTRSRVTIPTLGTLGETSPLAETVYLVPVVNGGGKARFPLPDITPPGLVANSFSSPVLYDPEGNELATTGTRARP